jgi:hypothetical protein
MRLRLRIARIFCKMLKIHIWIFLPFYYFYYILILILILIIRIKTICFVYLIIKGGKILDYNIIIIDEFSQE